MHGDIPERLQSYLDYDAMGHAQLSTTMIYADAIGKEEQDIAAKMWS